jgi:hypothetical protein
VREFDQLNLNTFDKLQFVRKFLFLGTVFLPLFSILYNPQIITKGLFDIRMISGLFCFALFLLSFKSKFVKKYLLSTLHVVAFLAIPYMSYVLYTYNFSLVWVVYHFIMFTAFSSLFFKKKLYLGFIIVYISCFAMALYKSEEILMETRLISFLMVAFIIINYVLFNSFLLNLDNLDKSTKQLILQNKALKKYAFLNAHKIRGPLARVLGLVDLIHLQGLKSQETALLDESAKELDKEIISAQKNLELELVDDKA